MKSDRAPRTRKRVSCEILHGNARYAGIVLDFSATGLWVQTNVKFALTDAARSGENTVTVNLKTPGSGETISLKARIARMRSVPPQFLGLQQGGIGLAIVDPPTDYLDFLEGISPEQSDSVARARERQARRRGVSATTKQDAPRAYRVHAVESRTGRKSSYLATAKSEDEANEQVRSQLGEEWQVLFIEVA